MLKLVLLKISDCNLIILPRYSDCQDLEDMDSTYSSSEDDTLEVRSRIMEEHQTMEQQVQREYSKPGPVSFPQLNFKFLTKNFKCKD